MKSFKRTLVVLLLVGLALMLGACKDTSYTDDLPQILYEDIMGQAPEGSAVISRQRASKVPDTGEILDPKNIWCVVTESEGVKARWLGTYIPLEDEDDKGIAMVVKDASQALFSQHGCDNWAGE